MYLAHPHPPPTHRRPTKGLGVDILSSAAGAFWGDAWEEGVVPGESEDEEDVVLPGGVSAAVYAQRVLRLMKRWGCEGFI